MRMIDYVGFVNRSGYGRATKNTIHALCQSDNYDVKLTLVGIIEKLSSSSKDFFNKLICKKGSHDRIQILHTIPDMYHRFPKRIKNVGVAVYETFEPPKHWVAVLNTVDAVIVPSLFDAEIFKEAGVKKPIFHIPHCIDIKQFHPSIQSMFSYKKFTFLFLGQWKERKGYRELLAAWVRTFSFEDPVQLVIKSDRPRVVNAYVKRVLSRCDRKPASIVIDSKFYTDEELPSFIKSAHCFVSPTMGEGFGLPGLEAMALGIPVIITNHSGCKDYVTEENCFLLTPERFERRASMDGIPQFSNKRWAVISVDQISDRMRYVFEHPEIAKKKSIIGSNLVKTNFNYRVLVKAFDKLMENLDG